MCAGTRYVKEIFPIHVYPMFNLFQHVVNYPCHCKMKWRPFVSCLVLYLRLGAHPPNSSFILLKESGVSWMGWPGGKGHETYFGIFNTLTTTMTHSFHFMQFIMILKF